MWGDRAGFPSVTQYRCIKGDIKALCQMCFLPKKKMRIVRFKVLESH